jgi:hypothetical protein
MKRIFCEDDIFDRSLFCEQYIVSFSKEVDGYVVKFKESYYSASRSAHRQVEAFCKKKHKRTNNLKIINIIYV